MPDLAHALPGGLSGAGTPDDAIAAIRDCLQRIKFGSIAVTIHEGRVVQLDVTEKRRLAK